MTPIGMAPIQDIPVGHIFQYRYCPCTFRRMTDMVALCVQTCEEHQGHEGRTEWCCGSLELQVFVHYDAFLAMLEAGEMEGA
jgi:hypothetical protein